MLSTRRTFAAMLCATALAGVWAWGCGGGQKSNEQASAPPAQTPPAATASTDTSAAASSSGAGDVARGEIVYKARCVLCHGPEGRGNGVGAAALNPKPRNHHDQAYMHSRTDAQLLDVIHNGKGQMPAWKTVLSEQEMKDVLAYVRKLGETP